MPIFVCMAAKILKRREAEIPGTVVLLFQPAEEGGAGGEVNGRGGCSGQEVLAVHGIHVMPWYPSGVVASIVN